MQSGHPSLCYTFNVSSFLLYAGMIGFALGIFARSFIQFGLIEVVWLLLISFILALVWRKNTRNVSSIFVLYGSIFLCGCALGGMRMEVASWGEIDPAFENEIGNEITIEGKVIREPDLRAKATHLYIEDNDEILLVRAPLHSAVQYGDVISATGLLQKPEPFETDLGRVFDYKGYLQARGVNYTLSFAGVEVQTQDQGNMLLSALFTFKHAFMDRVERLIPQPQAGLAHGLLLGVKQALGEEYETAFRTAGITHIVVLSGYNVMLVIMFVMYVLAFTLPFRARLLFGLAAIFMFACLVGFSATVVRACIMAALALVAKITGRTYAVVRALMVTAVVMLALNPYLLVYDAGFQLSFVATLGLILLSSHVEKYVQFMPKVFGLREFLTATIATQIFVMPLLLYTIGEFSVVSVIVNVLVLPMVPVAMLLTFATGMVAFVSATLALPIAYLASFSLNYILWVAVSFSKIPFASFEVPAFPFEVVVVVYSCFAYVLHVLLRMDKNRKAEAHDVSAWTIVEEKQLRENVALSAVEERSTIPIFFR
jgi:competence protein ComEC